MLALQLHDQYVASRWTYRIRFKMAMTWSRTRRLVGPHLMKWMRIERVISGLL